MPLTDERKKIVKQVAAIILAAGQSRRFGLDSEDSKVLALLKGRPLVRHVAEAAMASRAHPVFVIAGHAHQKIEAAVADLGVHVLRSPDPAAGLSQSLKVGLASVSNDADGAVILLADMPCVTAGIIDQLLDAFDTAPAGTRAVIPVRAGRRGNPVLLGKDIFEGVREIEGDRGARGLLESLEHGILEISIDDPAIGIDIDTPEMLVRHGGSV